MSRKKIRVAVAATIAGGFIAIGAANSFAAAPLSSATASDDGSDGIALGVPGVLTVSDSSSTHGSAAWSGVALAGTSLIGRDDSNAWVGPASALGGLLDSVNAATCDSSGGPLISQGIISCIALLPSGAGSSEDHGDSSGTLANAVVLDPGTVGAQITVLGSRAETDGCQSEAGSSILLVALSTPSGTNILEPGAAKALHRCEVR